METQGTRVIVAHPNQLKDLYFLKPCKSNERIMSTASVWSISVRYNGNVIPFHRRVYVELNENEQTARVYRARIGEEPIYLGALPYEKARRYCASNTAPPDSDQTASGDDATFHPYPTQDSAAEASQTRARQIAETIHHEVQHV